MEKQLRANVYLVSALAALLIAAPLLIRIPFARGFAELSLVGGSMTGPMLLGAAGLLLALAMVRGSPPTRALGLMVLALFAAVSLVVALHPLLPDHLFIVVYVYAPLLFLAGAALGRSQLLALDWFNRGSLDRSTRMALWFLVPASLAGLVAYHAVIGPDLTHQPLMRSGLPPILLFLVGLGIAALNSTVEEAIYRGVLFDALEKARFSAVLIVLIQAIGFGTYHLNSNEPGLAGVLVTFVLGLVLGGLRLMSRGMAAPFILHFAMDIGVWTLGMKQLLA